MHLLKLTTLAVKIVFSDKNYLTLYGVLFLTVFVLFIYIPVIRVPGNTLAFQISLFTFTDWFLLILLSGLTAISLAMNIFVAKRDLKSTLNTKTIGRGGFGALSGILGSVFGPTASCSSCVGSFFGFLGAGGVLFLLKYRQMIVALSIIIMLFTLYYTSKRVLGVCDTKIGVARNKGKK